MSLQLTDTIFQLNQAVLLVVQHLLDHPKPSEADIKCMTTLLECQISLNSELFHAID